MKPSQEAPRRRGRWIRFLLPAVAGVGLAWWMLEATRTRASWLELFASPRLVAGEPAKFVVHLAPGWGEGVVTLDLHWRTRQRIDRRVLLTGRPSKLDPARRDHLFEFVLPVNPDLGAVIAVVYVGPTGRWTERSRAAFSDPLEVASPGAPKEEASNAVALTELKRIPVFAPEPAILPPLERSGVIRYFAAALLLLSAGGLVWTYGLGRGAAEGRWRVGSMNSGGAEPRKHRDTEMEHGGPPTPRLGSSVVPSGSRNGWRHGFRTKGLALMLTVLALGEVTGVANWLTQRSRELAKANHVYAFRQDFQRPITLVVAAIGVGWMTWILRKPMPWAIRAVWMGCLGYLFLSVAGALSLHEFDALMVGSVLGATVFEGLKILASTMVFAGALGSLYERRSEQPG